MRTEIKPPSNLTDQLNGGTKRLMRSYICGELIEYIIQVIGRRASTHLSKIRVNVYVEPPTSGNARRSENKRGWCGQILIFHVSNQPSHTHNMLADVPSPVHSSNQMTSVADYSRSLHAYTLKLWTESRRKAESQSKARASGCDKTQSSASRPVTDP